MSMIFGVIAELPDVIDMRTFKKKKAMKNKKEGREWGENERSKKEGSSFYRLTP